MYKLEFVKTGMGASLYTKVVKVIDLSATNWTFVTKYEFESNFITTPTEEPKLNHWVYTQWNQLVVQFKPSNRCFKKVTFKFILFLTF